MVSRTKCLLTSALVSCRVFIMSPAWWHESINAAHNCTDLVCCFHLPDNSCQLNCPSDFSGLSWQRGNAFKPSTRAILSAFGWVQKLPSRFLQGYLTCFFVLLKSHSCISVFSYIRSLLSITHLIFSISVHVKLQKAKPRLSWSPSLEWVYNNRSSSCFSARNITAFPNISRNSFHPASLC